MSGKTKLICILSVVVLLLGGVFAFGALKDYLFSNPEGTIGNTPGNLNNGGLFCQSEDKIYFSNGYDNQKLYVMNLDETEIKCIAENSVSNINADSRHIYYFVDDFADVSGMGEFQVAMLGLYKADRNGRRNICLDRIICGTVQLIDNSLYYQRYSKDGATLEKMDIRSKKTETVLQYAANPACVVDGKIYYTGKERDLYLYSYDLNRRVADLVKEVNVWHPDYQEGYMYYMDIEDDYRLYRMNMASGERERLTADRCDAYIYCDGYIVYQKNSKSAPALMMMKSDGSEMIELAKGNYTDFGAANGVVYFSEYGKPAPMYKCRVVNGGQIQIFQAAEDAVKDKK